MELPAFYPKLNPARRRAVREEYQRRQKGRCSFCNTALTKEPNPAVLLYEVDKSLFPASFFNWPVHLHHDHSTGMTIGAVHCWCNAVLWQHFGE